MERVKLWLKAKVRPFEKRTIFSFGSCCGTSFHDLLLLALQVLDPGVEYIKSGAEPKTLAASAAAGFCNGLCPVLGEIAVTAGA